MFIYPKLWARSFGPTALPALRDCGSMTCSELHLRPTRLDKRRAATSKQHARLQVAAASIVRISTQPVRTLTLPALCVQGLATLDTGSSGLWQFAVEGI